MVPQILREHALYQAHGAKTAGHLEVEKTLARIKSEYCWDDLAKDLRGIEELASCAIRGNILAAKLQCKRSLRCLDLLSVIGRVGTLTMEPTMAINSS